MQDRDTPGECTVNCFRVVVDVYKGCESPTASTLRSDGVRTEGKQEAQRAHREAEHWWHSSNFE